MSALTLNSVLYPIVPGSFAAESFRGEYGQAIREGQLKRSDIQLADYRVDRRRPKGLGYKEGPTDEVYGGAWNSTCRFEGPYLTLPLVMQSTTAAMGDLSGEVAAAGRVCGVNTNLGNSSGKDRIYMSAGQRYGGTPQTPTRRRRTRPSPSPR